MITIKFNAIISNILKFGYLSIALYNNFLGALIEGFYIFL